LTAPAAESIGAERLDCCRRGGLQVDTRLTS